MTTVEAKKRREKRRRTSSLRAWCKAHGDGAQTLLMKRTGLTFAAINRIVHGKALPRPATAALLETATEGEVLAADLLGTDDTVTTNGASGRGPRVQAAGGVR